MVQCSDLLVAVACGLLQGVTEFLPVSSSGHLAALGILFGLKEISLTLVILLHAATLLATIIIFWPDLTRLALSAARGLAKPADFVRSEEGKLLIGVGISSVITVIVAFPLKDRVEKWIDVPWIVGICFWGSAVAALSTRWNKPSNDILSPAAACLVGLVQGIAALPGLSRSGVTIACAMALGLNAAAAFRYSFLLSIPVVAGATLLKLTEPGALSAIHATAWIAALVAFVSGCAALIWLKKLVIKGHLWRFAWYLFPLGAYLVLLDLINVIKR